MSMYAIGINKGFIEVREASEKPKRRVSGVTKRLTYPTQRPSAYSYLFNDARTPARMTFKVYSFEGGESIAIVKRAKFKSVVGYGVAVPARGTSVELPEGVASRFRDKSWLKTRLGIHV